MTPPEKTVGPFWLMQGGRSVAQCPSCPRERMDLPVTGCRVATMPHKASGAEYEGRAIIRGSGALDSILDSGNRLAHREETA